MTDSLFEQVLSVEDTSEFLDFIIPDYGLLLWPYVRYSILANCLERYFPKKYVFPSSVPAEGRLHRYGIFTKTILNFLRPWPKRLIWHYSAVGSAFYKLHNGRLYNIYTEPFAECLPNETLLLDASRGPEYIPTAVPYALRRVQPIRFFAGQITRFSPPAKYRILVDDFCAFVKERIQNVLGFSLAPDIMRVMAENLCHYTIPFVIAERRIFSFFLKKGRPRLLTIDDAFGGGYGHIILLAKEHGAIVAEHHHGHASKEHLAYSWANAMRTSATLARQLPDYFLTRGAYWHDKIRIPAQCRVLGHPWFAIQAASQPARSGAGILFALATFYEDFTPIIQAIVQAFPARTVIVRPHPSEHDFFYASSAAKIPGIHIDTNNDIYDTFPVVDTVVGELSSSLFEAAALGKRVFSRISPRTKRIYTDTAFERYESAVELIEKLKQPKPEISKKTQDAIFDRNWKENYINFFKDI